MSRSGDGNAFAARLARHVRVSGNGLCVGVDPPLSGMPKFFQADLERRGPGAFLDQYSETLIEAATGKAPAIKFQSAYFEAHGEAGFASLRWALGKAKSRGLVTLLDAKRGDIASTMAAYGRMAFDVMEADSLTVSPYMGLDVLEPLVPWLERGKGVYVVWVSSNPSGTLIQDLVADPLLGALAEFDKRVPGSIGLVLGATKVESLSEKTWRAAMPMPLLMPGVGAQGGTVTPRIKDAIQKTGTVLVPLSRGVGEFPADCASWEDYLASVRERLAATTRSLA